MMSWGWKSRSQRPIGLDIGHNSIKMIQLTADGGRMSVLAADKVRIDAGMDGDAEKRTSFVISAIKQMLAENSFCGRNVVSCLPNDELKITSLRLVESESDEIEQALKKEAAQRFGLDHDKSAIDYMVAGNVRDGDGIKNELILFAVDNGMIKKHIEMLEEAQLKPVAIDIVPCALFRSFGRLLRRQGDRERTTVFVDVGSRFTTVVFGRGGEINFIKQIPTGGEKFNTEIAARLGVNVREAEVLRNKLRMERSANTKASVWSYGRKPVGGRRELDTLTRQAMVDAIGAVAEELAREISLCFRYYTVTFRGKRVERAIFAGGEAYESILLNVLRRQLPVEIEVAEPLRGFDMLDVNFDSDKRTQLCEWAVAVGLSLKCWNRMGRKAGTYEGN